jgi:predicted pyridoxine 5'-phosphate oxidase superfamily flavin-nucleotide-binding protein
VPVTRTARISLTPDGIVRADIAPEQYQRLADAKENLAACMSFCVDARRPLLVDMRGGLPLEPETRHYYSGEALVDSFSAFGLLVDASPLGRMMGNVYFRVARPGIRTRLFSDEEAALTWLRAAVVPAP